MLSNFESGLNLPLKKSPKVFLSALAVATAFYGSPNQSRAISQPKINRSAETHRLQPGQAAILGKLTTQNNYYEWQHYKPKPKIQPVTDANSVDTPDWGCVMSGEGSNSGGNYTQTSGAFGIEPGTWVALWQSMGFTLAESYPTPGSAPPVVQNEAALILLARNHYHFKGTWNDYCTEEGLVH